MKNVLLTLMMVLMLATGSAVTTGCASAPHSLVENSEQIYQAIQEASVMIGHQTQSGQIALRGSGTVVAFKDGYYYILTARHVVNDLHLAKAWKTVIIYKGKVLPAELVGEWTKQFAGKDDYHLLRVKATVDMSPMTVIPLANKEMKLGQAVLVNPHFPYRTVMVLRGHVAAISPDKTMMLLSVSANPGASGSGVIVIQGGKLRVVGVTIAVAVSGPNRIPSPGSHIACATVYRLQIP